MKYDWEAMDFDYQDALRAVNAPIFITNAFVWADSPQGDVFWCEVFDDEKHTNESLKALQEMINAYECEQGLSITRFYNVVKGEFDTVSEGTGYKLDEGKLRYDLIPPEFLEGTAEILTYGAKKYAPRQWEGGMAWSRPYGALLRHLFAWWNPFEPDTDPETGKSHLFHACCCLAFLVTYEARKIGKDDRK